VAVRRGLTARRPTREQGILGGLMLLVFGLYAVYALTRHKHYLTTGFDLGIFDQVVRDYSRFQAPIVPLKAPGYNLLGDHFHPILVLWAPLYWIWDDPRMLLLAQAALLAVSMMPIHRFTRRRLGGTAALWVAGLYGLSWPLQRMVQFDVHEIAFAVPLIALVIDAVDRRARWLTWLCCLGLLLTREDMGALVLLIGVLVAVREVRLGLDRQLRPRRDDVLHGLALMALGVFGYWLATSVVIPHFSDGLGFVYWTFPALGPDPASALRFMITQPWSVLVLLVTPFRKTQTLLALGSSTLFTALGSRWILLTAPFLAQRFLNSRELLWNTNFHYSAVLAPILFAAGVETVNGWRRRLAKRPEGVLGGRLTSGRLVRGWLIGCVALWTANMLLVAGDYPLSRLAMRAFWTADSRAESITRMLPLIPRGVCVEADNAVVPQLTTKDYVTRINRSDDMATWMILDFSRSDTGWESPTPKAAYAQALERGFVPVGQDGVIVVLHRDAPVDPVCTEL